MTGSCLFVGIGAHEYQKAVELCATTSRLGGHGQCEGIRAKAATCGEGRESNFVGCLALSRDQDGTDCKILSDEELHQVRA